MFLLIFTIKITSCSPKKQKKNIAVDVIKSLTYEFALQQTHTVSLNVFFIPWYYATEPQSHPLGESESNLDIKGIKVFKANFFLLQKIYLEESLCAPKQIL